MPCAVVAVILVAAAIPAPAHAQLGGLIKKKVKEKAAQTIGRGDSAMTASPDTSAPVAAGKAARTAPPRSGPRFTEYVLEITPELLDRLEKGLAAEEVVRQAIERKIGKVLSRDEYKKCEAAVLRGPEGQKVYQQSRDLANGDTRTSTYRRHRRSWRGGWSRWSSRSADSSRGRRRRSGSSTRTVWRRRHQLRPA
jgi:hypothetical protein